MATEITNGTDVLYLNSDSSYYGTPQIQSVRNGKDAQLIFSPIPNSDSNKSIGFDLYGVKREITLQGIVVGNTLQLEHFFTVAESFIDGGQWGLTNKSLTFRLDVSSQLTYSVLMKSFFWTWDKGAPSKLNYTMILAEVDPDQGA